MVPPWGPLLRTCRVELWRGLRSGKPGSARAAAWKPGAALRCDDAGP
jgi:hypothetical protein